MFLRCVKIIKIKKINSINLILAWLSWFAFKISETFSLKTVTIKTVKDENIEDTEENLKIRETTIQVNINKILKDNDKANSIPKYVATPFPPLNFIQNGKICPKKTIKAENWTCSGKKYVRRIFGH